MKDVQTAIGQSLFSAMYPEEIDHKKTSNNIIQSVITLLVDQHLENEASNTDELNPQCRNLRDKLESFNKIESRSSYVTKDPYYTSNPILKERYSKVFNNHFLEFYDYLKNCKGTLLELLKVRVTEHDVVSHKFGMVCHITSK